MIVEEGEMTPEISETVSRSPAPIILIVLLAKETEYWDPEAV